MDEDDHSFIDLVEGTPSPVFKRIRRTGSSNLSRLSLSNQDSTSSVESISALNRAPNLSTGSLSPSKSPGLPREDLEPRPYFSLPGETNLTEERTRAIQRKKLKDKTSSFNPTPKKSFGPVFKRIRRMDSSNLSRPSLSNQGSNSSLESISALNRAPNLSTGSLSPSKSPGLLREDPRPYLSLPGETNFVEERARAIQRKKHKDKTSPFKLPKHAKSDFVKSSTLLTSSPPKTYQMKRPTTQGTSAQPSSTITGTQPCKRKDGFTVSIMTSPPRPTTQDSSSQPSSTITGTQSSKRKNGFTVPTLTSPPKPLVNRDRAIGWPSSSDSSSDDELYNNMAFKAKRIKHRQGSDNSHSHKSGNSTNSLSICNHMRHSGTNQAGYSSNSGTSETACKHGKNGTTKNLKQFGKRMSDADDGSQKKAKKMKTNVEETSSGLSSLNRKTNFDGVIAKPCNSSLIKAGVTRFGNNTDDLHNFGATFTSTQKTDAPDTVRPGRSDDWLSSKQGKGKLSSNYSGDCASKSNKPSSTSTSNTVPPNFDCSLSLIRNSSHSVVGRNPHTYNSDKSPTLVSTISVQNFYKSPTVDRHTNSSHATTSPSLDRRRQISRNLSPGFDQQVGINSTSRQTTPNKITKPPSPIFSPPDIIGHNSNESYDNRQPKTPERPRPKLPRPHPYGRSSKIRSPHRPSSFSPARNLGSPYAAFIDSLRTETLDGGISRAREEMRRRSRDRQARSSGNSTNEDLVVVDLTTPESSRVVKQIEQMEKDAEMARKLQEELDKEFAMTLAQQQESHSHEHEHRHFTDPGADYDMYSSHHHDNQRPGRPGRLWEDQAMDLGQHFGQFSPRPAQRGGNSSRNRRTRGGGARGMDENQLDQLLAELGNTVDMRMFQLLTPITRGRRRGRGRHHYVTPDRGGNDYDELLRLGEMIGDAVKKGLSKSEMNRLPTFTYKKSDGENQEVECNICMCNYEDGDMQKILPCFHSYHSECIDQWIAKNATCPVCRVEIKL